MRRIWSLFLMGMTVMMLAGCGSGQEVVSGVDTQEAELSDAGEETQEDTIMMITVNDTKLTAVMEDNSSVEALMELLAKGPLMTEMSDYANMEKVGSVGTALPRNKVIFGDTLKQSIFGNRLTNRNSMEKRI